jgi:hypothetical protein
MEIDEADVIKLAQMNCTMKEIAAFCNCSVDTLERRFADVIAKGKEQGRISLRRLQWQSAQKGNVVMQLFLGKNMLGQADKQEIEHSASKIVINISKDDEDL